MEAGAQSTDNVPSAHSLSRSQPQAGSDSRDGTLGGDAEQNRAAKEESCAERSVSSAPSATRSQKAGNTHLSVPRILLPVVLAGDSLEVNVSNGLVTNHTLERPSCCFGEPRGRRASAWVRRRDGDSGPTAPQPTDCGPAAARTATSQVHRATGPGNRGSSHSPREGRRLRSAL